MWSGGSGGKQELERHAILRAIGTVHGPSYSGGSGIGKALDLPIGRTWAHQHPFFLLLNVAAGGTWPGNPDASTVFPQKMQVDRVREWQL